MAVLLALFLMGSFGHRAYADGVVNAIKDTGTDIKGDTKKTVRKAKREGRKTTGNDTILKDAHDNS